MRTTQPFNDPQIVFAKKIQTKQAGATPSSRFRPSFFDALHQLCTWSVHNLTFASTIDLYDAWNVNLTEARRCALYRAETIDPNHHGHLRYDIMCEIVKLESHRIQDFLDSFDHSKHDLWYRYHR
jgi:hypothetical protein